jgi:hypothetical protein
LPANAVRNFLAMPITTPVLASDRDERRPRPLPPGVQNALCLMVYGDPAAGDDAKPLSFVQAANAVGLTAAHFRKWLDRPAAIQFLRRERAIYRRALCSANEFALANIRDRGANDAARVRSVLALEAIDMQDTTHRRTEGETAGITIVISAAPSPRPVVTIDADVEPIGTIEHRPTSR